MSDFDGKIALVTGTSGIGLGAAIRFARGGARVFCAGIDPALNEQAETDCAGLDVTVSRVDVSSEDDVARWVGEVTSAQNGVDILVNAAAVQTYGDTASTDIGHWNRVIGVNLTSCYLTSHFAYPHMKRRGGGSIVHVSSVQGHQNQNGVLAYATTKGGIHALTRAQAVDAARDNIRVNSISPGSIRTPLLEFAARQVAGEDGR